MSVVYLAIAIVVFISLRTTDGASLHLLTDIDIRAPEATNLNDIGSHTHATIHISHRTN